MIVKNIKKLCSTTGTSLSALEKTLNFGNSTIAKWEEHSPSVDKLKKVADYFGVTVDELLKEDE